MQTRELFLFGCVGVLLVWLANVTILADRQASRSPEIGGIPDDKLPWARGPSEQSPASREDQPTALYEAPSGILPELDTVAAIFCEFGSGRTGGVQSAPIATAEWQGGSLAFDSINVAENTALMRGSAGATGRRLV